MAGYQFRRRDDVLPTRTDSAVEGKVYPTFRACSKNSGQLHAMYVL